MIQHTRNRLFIIFVLVFSIAAVVFIYAQGGAGSDTKSSEVSGTLDHGLRVIDVDPTVKKPSYTVYRGDYVVFAFREGGLHKNGNCFIRFF